MFSFSGLKRGIVWMSLAVFFVVKGYCGGPKLFLVRPPSVEFDIRCWGSFFDDDEDRRVLAQTRGVFGRVAERVVLGEYDTPEQQGNALGLLLQMVVNNWTYNNLLDTAEAAFTRIFEYGNPWRGALLQLIDSIEEEYGDGASNADRLMRWILAAMCREATPIPYHDVRLQAYELLMRTRLVPRGFVSVFDVPNQEEEQERLYRIQLAALIEAIKRHIACLVGGLCETEEEQLGALDAIFDLATGTPQVREDMALIETVTTGYDRIFRQVDFHEGALLAFIQGLGAVHATTESSRNLVQCILVLLCEKDTLVPHGSVRRSAFALLQSMNAVPPGFIMADLAGVISTAD